MKLTGKNKITVHTGKVKLKGSVGGNVSKVTYRVGSKGKFKPAKGTTNWTITASHLKTGKNIVTIQAKGLFGTSSTKVTVTVDK